MRYYKYLIIIFFTLKAYASGLQVAPVNLELIDGKKSGEIWLSNSGNNVIHAQVRIYKWEQKNFENSLNLTKEVVVSPPILQIPPQKKQLVRVIYNGNNNSNKELAFRLLVDEIPNLKSDTGGLNFLLSYSIPVFIQPKSFIKSEKLSFKLIKLDKKTYLEVTNEGTIRAQLADVNYVKNDGKLEVIFNGLLGYVLPNATMHWLIPNSSININKKNKLEILINGIKKTQEV